MTNIDAEEARGRLLRLLSVEGVTGAEAAIGREIVAALRQAGVAGGRIGFDAAQTRIALPTETGNLIVDLPGRGRQAAEPRLLFMTHMDTVPLAAGARPRKVGERIQNDSRSALGGDNRTGCAVLVTLAAELQRHGIDHPPLTLLFTVREESGLWGARYVDTALLGEPAMGFNFDGRSAAHVTIGAIGAEHWQAEIHGRAAHAGGAPERGISAMLILARALDTVHAGGWFGKVAKGGKLGTSNVGPVGGPGGGPAWGATNVVTDFVQVAGESRSHDAAFCTEITQAYRLALEAAARALPNASGQRGTIHFTSRADYPAFRLSDREAVVQRAVTAVQANGGTPEIRITNGGLDANWMAQHGIPTVTFGAGQNEVHTIEEWIDLKEFDAACRLALRLATS